jgi:hypothetical protein
MCRLKYCRLTEGVIFVEDAPENEPSENVPTEILSVDGWRRLKMNRLKMCRLKYCRLTDGDA